MSIKPIWRKKLNPCNTSNELNVNSPTPMSKPLTPHHEPSQENNHPNQALANPYIKDTPTSPQVVSHPLFLILPINSHVTHTQAPPQIKSIIRPKISPVKAKKPSKRASKAKKNDIQEKEPPKEWTTTKEIALCRGWCDVSENCEKENAAGGFNLNNEAVESEKETQEQRPVGRDQAKKKKKSSASSRGGSSSFVDLVADKFFNI
nr:hypothetical protein [Tanacetum cinerariifolium]